MQNGGLQGAGPHLTGGRQRCVPRVNLLVVVVHRAVWRRALHVTVAKLDHRGAVPQRVLRSAVAEPYRPAAIHKPLFHAAVRMLDRARTPIRVHLRRRWPCGGAGRETPHRWGRSRAVRSTGQAAWQKRRRAGAVADSCRGCARPPRHTEALEHVSHTVI